MQKHCVCIKGINILILEMVLGKVRSSPSVSGYASNEGVVPLSCPSV